MKDYDLRYELIHLEERLLEKNASFLISVINGVLATSIPERLSGVAVSVNLPIIDRIRRRSAYNRLKSIEVPESVSAEDVLKIYLDEFEINEIDSETFDFDYCPDDDANMWDIFISLKGEDPLLSSKKRKPRLFQLLIPHSRFLFYMNRYTTVPSFYSEEAEKKFSESLENAEDYPFTSIYLLLDSDRLISNSDVLNMEIKILSGLDNESVREENDSYMDYLENLDRYLRTIASYRFNRDYEKYLERSSNVR